MIDNLDHKFFMREALKEAEKVLAEGERPIGAVIVHRGEIISRAHLRKPNLYLRSNSS